MTPSTSAAAGAVLSSAALLMGIDRHLGRASVLARGMI
jgi:hypothetical protein